MKDGRTHLAHKAEHAVDLDTGAVVAVIVQPADCGDTTTVLVTATEAVLEIVDGGRTGKARRTRRDCPG